MRKLKKVRIIRSKERVGSIRARTLGMSAAIAPVVTVLDSHCECFDGMRVLLCQNRVLATEYFPCPTNSNILHSLSRTVHTNLPFSL